jgi:hypothetical protein
MSYHYRGLTHSYDIPDPEEMPDAGVEELVEKLKASIEAGKLKEMRSALSKLKLGINSKYPEYTEQTAEFTAYIYAKEGGHKKAIDSLYNTLIKTKYNFKTKVLPLKKLIDSLSKSQMKIIFDEFLNDSSFLWKINGAANINSMYENYPKETEEYITKKDKLYGYPAGDERMASAKAMIANGSADSILIMFESFYGPSFLKDFTFAAAKIKTCLVALNKRPQNIQDRVRKEYFYKTAARALNTKLIMWEYDKGKLDEETIKIFTDDRVGKNGIVVQVAMQYITQLDKEGDKYKELISTMISSNEFLLNYIAEFVPKFLSQDVKDIFMF